MELVTQQSSVAASCARTRHHRSWLTVLGWRGASGLETFKGGRFFHFLYLASDGRSTNHQVQAYAGLRRLCNMGGMQLHLQAASTPGAWPRERERALLPPKVLSGHRRWRQGCRVLATTCLRRRTWTVSELVMTYTLRLLLVGGRSALGEHTEQPADTDRPESFEAGRSWSSLSGTKTAIARNAESRSPAALEAGQHGMQR